MRALVSLPCLCPPAQYLEGAQYDPAEQEQVIAGYESNAGSARVQEDALREAADAQQSQLMEKEQMVGEMEHKLEAEAIRQQTNYAIQRAKDEKDWKAQAHYEQQKEERMKKNIAAAVELAMLRNAQRMFPYQNQPPTPMYIPFPVMGAKGGAGGGGGGGGGAGSGSSSSSAAGGGGEKKGAEDAAKSALGGGMGIGALSDDDDAHLNVLDALRALDLEQSEEARDAFLWEEEEEDSDIINEAEDEDEDEEEYDSLTGVTAVEGADESEGEEEEEEEWASELGMRML